MPNKKTTAEDKKATPAFRGYVRMDIRDKGDLDKFHDYEAKVTKMGLWDSLAGMVADGYKITLKVDGKGYRIEAFNVSAEEEAHGYILAAYGSGLEKAATALVFKHEILMGSSWLEHLAQEEVEVR
jgi:hypothetical protein